MVHPLKDFRKNQHLTQGQLAGRLGVARTTVARWETGERNIGDDVLPKVSEVTGIAKTDLRPDLVRLLEQTEGEQC